MATRGALRSAYPLRVAARKKTKKAYRIPATQVRFVDMGGGIATDRITVDGAPVGFMRRGVPLAPEDSGWSFYAGDETKRSLADRSTSAVWHVNDVANLDPAIVPYLYALPGAAFERDAASGRFVETPESRPDPEVAGLPAGVSVVQGEVQVAEGLVVHLPTPFRSRVEDGSLVLWRPGLTFWIAAGAARGAPEIPEDALDPGSALLVLVLRLDLPQLAAARVVRDDALDARHPREELGALRAGHPQHLAARREARGAVVAGEEQVLVVHDARGRAERQRHAPELPPRRELESEHGARGVHDRRRRRDRDEQRLADHEEARREVVHRHAPPLRPGQGVEGEHGLTVQDDERRGHATRSLSRGSRSADEAPTVPAAKVPAAGRAVISLRW